MNKKIYARRVTNRYFILAIIFIFILSSIFYLMGIVFRKEALFIALGMVLTLVLIESLRRILYSLRIKHRTWGQGAKGEEIVAEYLEEGLGSGNLVINDVELPNERGNIDHLVIGKHGIFVIETKTNKGSVTCDGDIWENKNFGKDGTRYGGDIGSPSKQVKAQTLKLNKFFKEHYPKLSNAWIDAIVVFANRNTKLKIKNNPTHCSIIKSPENLVKHIKKQQTKTMLSGKDLYNLNKIFADFSSKSILTRSRYNVLFGKEEDFSKPYF